MRTRTIKGASMPKSELNAYGVGLMRLRDMHISAENFEYADIEFIGECSLSRRKVVIGKVGNVWSVWHRVPDDVWDRAQAKYGENVRFKAYYIVEGKRVTSLHPSLYPNKTTEQIMREYECRDLSKPVRMMDAEELFYAAKGSRPSRKHAPKMRLATRLANAARMEK